MEPYFFQFFSNCFSEFHLEKSISIGDLLAFCSILIAIYQFSKQMVASRKEHLRAQKENWYLSIIVLPELNSIKEFYDNLVNDIISRKKSLMTSRCKEGYDVMVSQNQAEVIENISNYFIKLINLVRSYNKKLGDILDDHIDKLQDICTNLLSNDLKDPRADIRKLIMNHESSLIALLNKGLSVNK